MNVFVLTAGRTASSTFAKACQYIDGFTAGHETRVDRFFDDRLAYPDDHIEVDNRLAFFLGALDKKYGDTAYYVHLMRNPSKVASSYRKRWYYRESIVRAFYINIMLARNPKRADYDRACDFYVATNTSNIQHFLKDKSKHIDFHLENAKEDFHRFVNWLGRDCDERALSAWDEPINLNKQIAPGPKIVKALKRVGRTVRAIPYVYWDS